MTHQEDDDDEVKLFNDNNRSGCCCSNGVRAHVLRSMHSRMDKGTCFVEKAIELIHTTPYHSVYYILRI